MLCVERPLYQINSFFPTYLGKTLYTWHNNTVHNQATHFLRLFDVYMLMIVISYILQAAVFLSFTTNPCEQQWPIAQPNSQPDAAF